MKELLIKEMHLAASPLSWLFILFAFMTMLPGYPILLGAFFVCFGIFHTVQSVRENNDVLYTVLLPVRKSDAVRARFLFTLLIQLLAFVLMLALTILRMTVFAGVAPYVNNAMMNANQVYLAWALMIFSAFQLVFLRGFYKTAYYYGKPFVQFIVAAFLMIGIAETLHHIPGLQSLNETATVNNIRLWGILLATAICYLIATMLSIRAAIRSFENIDL